jgi:hypothetical protein
MLEFQLLAVPQSGDSATNQRVVDEMVTQQGWLPVPGTVPVLMVAVFRPAQAQTLASGQGFGALKLDESKIQVIKSDGSVREH